jgi:hypothetical protein
MQRNRRRARAHPALYVRNTDTTNSSTRLAGLVFLLLASFWKLEVKPEAMGLAYATHPSPPTLLSVHGHTHSGGEKLGQPHENNHTRHASVCSRCVHRVGCEAPARDRPVPAPAVCSRPAQPRYTCTQPLQERNGCARVCEAPQSQWFSELRLIIVYLSTDDCGPKQFPTA